MLIALLFIVLLKQVNAYYGPMGQSALRGNRANNGGFGGAGTGGGLFGGGYSATAWEAWAKAVMDCEEGASVEGWDKDKSECAAVEEE